MFPSEVVQPKASALQTPEQRPPTFPGRRFPAPILPSSVGAPRFLPVRAAQFRFSLRHSYLVLLLAASRFLAPPQIRHCRFLSTETTKDPASRLPRRHSILEL